MQLPTTTLHRDAKSLNGNVPSIAISPRDALAIFFGFLLSGCGGGESDGTSIIAPPTSTSVLSAPVTGKPYEFTLSNLISNTRYFYRLQFTTSDSTTSGSTDEFRSSI